MWTLASILWQCRRMSPISNQGKDQEMPSINNCSRMILSKETRWRVKCLDWPRWSCLRGEMCSIEVSYCLNGTRKKIQVRDSFPSLLSWPIIRLRTSWQRKTWDRGRINPLIRCRTEIGESFDRIIKFTFEEERHLIQSGNGGKSKASKISW